LNLLPQRGRVSGTKSRNPGRESIKGNFKCEKRKLQAVKGDGRKGRTGPIKLTVKFIDKGGIPLGEGRLYRGNKREGLYCGSPMKKKGASRVKKMQISSTCWPRQSSGETNLSLPHNVQPPYRKR